MAEDRAETPEPATLHVACPDAATAGQIAAAAVEARLAACGNILPGVESVFRWEGTVQRETEALLILKTTAARIEALVALVQERHPYDLPAITWDCGGADPETRAWLAGETG